MKKLLKSKQFLLWSPVAVAITGLWALTGSGVGLVVFIVLGFLSAVNALWHSLDKDVKIED